MKKFGSMKLKCQLRGYGLVEVAVALAITAVAIVFSLGISNDQLMARNAEGFAKDMADLTRVVDSAFTGQGSFLDLNTQLLVTKQLVLAASTSSSGGTAQVFNRYGGRIYADGWARTAGEQKKYQLIQSTSIPIKQCRTVMTALSAQMKQITRAPAYVIAVAGPPSGNGLRLDDRFPDPLTVDPAGRIVGTASASGNYETPVIVDYAMEKIEFRLTDLATFCERDISFFTMLLLSAQR